MDQQRFRRLGALSVTAALALVVLAACGSEREPVLEEATRVPVMSDAAAQATREAPPPGSPEAGGEGTAVAASPESGGEPPAAGETVEIVSVDIAFQPTEVTIPANTDVTFSLPNNGVTAHNFAIDELGISVDQAPGAVEEIVINAPPGEYQYYCNVPGHKEAGMVGTLIVTEDAAASDTAGTAAEQAASPEAEEVPPGEATPAAATAAAETIAETGAASPAALVETIAAGEEPAEASSTIAAALGDASPTTGTAEQAATPAVATPAPAASPATDDGGAPSTAETVEVVSIDIAFDPTEITIPANTDVTIVLPNNGVTAHNFAIDELGISVDQAPGSTEEIVINAPAGTYEYYCNVPGHKQAGMVGTLTVE